MGKTIGRQEAKKIAQKYFTPSLDDIGISDGLPSFGEVYISDRGKDDEYWTVSVPWAGPSSLGTVPVIIISKKTGKVVYDGDVGE